MKKCTLLATGMLLLFGVSSAVATDSGCASSAVSAETIALVAQARATGGDGIESFVSAFMTAEDSNLIPAFSSEPVGIIMIIR